MKSIHWILAFAVCVALPGLSHAEIYKWKDKDGQTRYTDTPPPSHIKTESINGKKTIKPTGKAPLSNVPNTAPVPAAPQSVANPPPVQMPAGNPEDEAAQVRQQNAEREKQNKQEQESQAKLKAENCRAARANFESYSQGGRIYKMNEKGEREYMGDADLKDGIDKARAQIAEYCN